MTIPFLLRNLPEENRNEIRKVINLENELEFYKSIFKTHYNSAIFNLRIKTINGERLWVDKIKISSDPDMLNSLDKDDEVLDWLKPVKFER
jgi:hypothetical protein